MKKNKVYLLENLWSYDVNLSHPECHENSTWNQNYHVVTMLRGSTVVDRVGGGGGAKLRGLQPAPPPHSTS